MLKPRRLQPGDRVAVVAPASPCSPEDIEAGCAELRRVGFEPVCASRIDQRDLFTAGTAAARVADFIDAWSDPTIAALVAVRGGYGSAQLLGALPTALLREAPKVFCGYSDTTAVLTWLTCHVGVTALHGPMLDRRFAKGPSGYDVASFLAAATGHEPWVARWADGVVVREGEARGPLFGGTLTQLVASLGTPFAFAPPAGALLFIEDVNERPYRIHRMLTQLDQSGILGRAAAVVFGEMVGCDEPGGHVTAVDAVRHALAQFPGPIVMGLPSGHTVGPMQTVPLGVMARVSTGPYPQVEGEESAVA